MAATRTEGKTHFYNVVGGRFMLHAGKGAEPEPFDTVDGALRSVSVYRDQAKGYAPFDALRIVLEDGGERHVVQTHADTHFARMFAGYARGLKAGEAVRLQAKPGQNPKVSFCFVEVDRGRGWEKARYEKVEGEGDRARSLTKGLLSTLPYHEEHTGTGQAGRAATDPADLERVKVAFFEAAYAKGLATYADAPHVWNGFMGRCLSSRTEGREVGHVDELDALDWATCGAQLKRFLALEPSMWAKALQELKRLARDPFAEEGW